MAMAQHGWRCLLGAGTVAAVLAAAPGLRAAQPDRPTQERELEVPETVQVHPDVPYGSIGGKSLLMDMYRPRARRETAMPALVYVHGGAWRGGSKKGVPPLALVLAAEGYFVASIDYRLSSEAVFPAQIQDCKCAIRYVRAHAREYGVDPDRIGAWGHSAGGHLVALLGTAGDVREFEGQGGWEGVSSRVQAVVDCFGPTDFLRMTEGLKALGFPDRIGHDSPTSPESLLLGGPVLKNKEKAAAANPITYVTKDDPPFLILHGDRDATVPMNQSELLHEALGKAGVESTYHVVKGAGHGFGGAEVDGLVRTFLGKHLRAKPPAK